MDESSWKKILNQVKQKSPSLGGLLCSSKLKDFDGQKLNISVYYKFHKDKLEENKNKSLIENAVLEVLQKQIILECVVEETPKNANLTEGVNQNIMTAAEEIFA